MCRWFIYFGNKTILKNILFTEKHSIIKQSYQKKFTPFLDEPNKRDHEINVDGFGVGWYVNKHFEPCLYTSTKTPWSDQNIIRISNYINTKKVFAHIRAIKPFSNSVVNENNCHPFTYKNFMFMHNGDISDINDYKKDLIGILKNNIFSLYKGNTDSEFAFLIFLNQLEEYIIKNGGYLTKNKMKSYIINVIDTFLFFGKNPMSLNFAVTDGKTIICTRFINSEIENPPSLYYKKIDNNIFISSEPTNYDNNWEIIKKNSILTYNKKNIEIENLDF